jgi:hypothetical protein
MLTPVGRKIVLDSSESRAYVVATSRSGKWVEAKTGNEASTVGDDSRRPRNDATGQFTSLGSGRSDGRISRGHDAEIAAGGLTMSLRVSLRATDAKPGP